MELQDRRQITYVLHYIDIINILKSALIEKYSHISVRLAPRYQRSIVRFRDRRIYKRYPLRQVGVLRQPSLIQPIQIHRINQRTTQIPVTQAHVNTKHSRIFLPPWYIAYMRIARAAAC